MNCRRVGPLLFDHLEGLLPEREAGAVAAHLDGCPSCRRRRDTFMALRAELCGLSEILPPPHLARRAVQRWAVERDGMQREAHRGPTAAVITGTMARRLMAGPGTGPALRAPAFAAALVFFALLSHALVHWNHSAPRRQPDQIAGRSDFPSQNRDGNESTKERPNSHAEGQKGTRAPAGTGRDTRLPGGGADTSYPPPNLAPARGPAPPSRLRDERPEPVRTIAQGGDDLKYLNGDDPVRNVRPWAPVTRDEWDEIEAKVRRNVRVRDDFVQIAFPRIAGAAEGAIVAAVEQYKREAAIVDPRLFHEVTLAQKATALSDLCDHLRNDTGIQLAAGPSVADEKVTLFCERLPLREVMRQLSRPFGYTWLRSKKDGEYRYELVQDLKSQLLEENLRTRDRNAALIALERDMDGYRPLLGLSPDEALARSKTAAPEERKRPEQKNRLEYLATYGWGPIQMYFRLTPQEQAALRAGQELKFSQEPKPGELPLPPDVARAVLQSDRKTHLVRHDGRLASADGNDPNGMPLTAVPEARATVTLRIGQMELGQFTLEGGSGFFIDDPEMTARTGKTMASSSEDAYALGLSPTVLQPDNRAANTKLAGDPALRPRVSVRPQPSSWLSTVSYRISVRAGSSADSRQPAADQKVTSADVLEALHRACGLPIIADYYTRLYKLGAVSVQNQPLFDALNHLADAMRLRWNKDAGGGTAARSGAGPRGEAGHARSGGTWLQFRSASFYDDRLKEVPNRLLTRWASARQQHAALPLDELLEIAQLPDVQLDSGDMREGARECWGLAEWDLLRYGNLRPHLRFLAQLTPAQRQAAMSPTGLAFTRMSLAQQQQFMPLALGSAADQLHSLEELAGAALRVAYTQPGSFEWQVPQEVSELPGHEPIELPPVRERTQAAALQAVRRIYPRVQEAQIVPTELALTVLYTWGDPKTLVHARVLRATPSHEQSWGRNHRFGSDPNGEQSRSRF